MDTWKHGKYFDLWSLVHLLSGALLGVGFYGLGFSFELAAALSAATLFGWEVFEFFKEIIEPSPNVAIDIVVGYGGFLFAAYYHYHLGNSFSGYLFIFHAVLLGLLALWGYLDFRKRGYR